MQLRSKRNKKFIIIVMLIIFVALVVLNIKTIQRRRRYSIKDMKEPLSLYYTEYQIFNISVYNFKRINFNGVDYTSEVWKIEKIQENNIFMYMFKVEREAVEEENYSYWTEIKITPEFKKLIIFQIKNNKIARTESSETYDGYLIDGCY